MGGGVGRGPNPRQYCAWHFGSTLYQQSYPATQLSHTCRCFVGCTFDPTNRYSLNSVSKFDMEPMGHFKATSLIFFFRLLMMADGDGGGDGFRAGGGGRGRWAGGARRVLLDACWTCVDEVRANVHAPNIWHLRRNALSLSLSLSLSLRKHTKGPKGSARERRMSSLMSVSCIWLEKGLRCKKAHSFLLA